MQSDKQEPRPRSPTVLDVYCECLAIIQTLEQPADRVACVKALESFRCWFEPVLRGGVTDWEAQAGKARASAKKWRARAEELEAELALYGDDEEAEFEAPLQVIGSEAQP